MYGQLVSNYDFQLTLVDAKELKINPIFLIWWDLFFCKNVMVKNFQLLKI